MKPLKVCRFSLKISFQKLWFYDVSVKFSPLKIFFNQQRKRTRSSSRGEERALTNHHIVKSLLLKQLCVCGLFSDTTGLEEQERAKRRQVMEKFQKAPFEEIAAHCESKVIKKKKKKRARNQKIINCQRIRKNTQINSCSLLPGKHAARPARTNLWTHNQVSLLCKFSNLNIWI